MASLYECVQLVITVEGILAGGLKVTRRAPGNLYAAFWQSEQTATLLIAHDLGYTCFALAGSMKRPPQVAELVTPPLNVLRVLFPAVLVFSISCLNVTQAIVCYLLTAAAIGILYKNKMPQSLGRSRLSRAK